MTTRYFPPYSVHVRDCGATVLSRTPVQCDYPIAGAAVDALTYVLYGRVYARNACSSDPLRWFRVYIVLRV